MHIKEIKLQTAVPEDLAFFYGETLGLNVAAVAETIQVHTSFSKLIFTKTNDNSEPYYHFAFNIPSNKIMEAFEWMNDKATVLWIKEYNDYIADFNNWNAKSIYFLDPAGNIVEFISRFDLNDNSFESFSSSSIISVSEIGLVFPTDSIEKNVDQILFDYSLSYFNKQGPLPQFKAIGNDNGLLICVPEERNWFPTENRPAHIFPLEIIITQENREFIYKN